MITLIGLGPGDENALTLGAERALRTASEAAKSGNGALFVRTERHPIADALRRWDLKFESFDALYDAADDFQSLYEDIAERVIAVAGCGDVAYAVPGHPLFGEQSVSHILGRARSEDIPVTIVSSGSFVEAAIAAVCAPVVDGVDARDALLLSATDEVDERGLPVGARLDVTRPLLLFQVFDERSASHAKLALMRDYPDDWEIAIVRWAGIPDREQVSWIPLFRLDREPVDHLTSVYIPPLPPERRSPGFPSLVGVMAKLRAPGGCPWDREQTHETLKRYFLEETYEVLEAIDAGDVDLLCEELGDALLQVVFHAQLAAEEGVFNVDDVSRVIVEKLVRRHPHVFGAVEVAGSDEVLVNWERIKREENSANPEWRKSALDGVPRALPALMQAMEISKRAVKIGFEWPSLADVMAKLDEEVAELKHELAAPAPDGERVASEIGDLLFTVVQIARWRKIDAEDALRQMILRFSTRFRHMEARAREAGKSLENLTPEELDELWNEAKAWTETQAERPATGR